MKKIRFVFLMLLIVSVMTACGKDDKEKVKINIVDKPDYDIELDDEDWDTEYDGKDFDDESYDADYDDSDESTSNRVERDNGHVYEYFDEDITWTEAREACIDMGGHLLTIVDQEEADFIYDNFYDKKAWIGAYKFGEVWYWVTHEDWGFTNWDNNEPSNSKGAEWCVHLWTDMRWNDLADEDVKNVVSGYICEFDDYTDHGDY